MDQLLAAQRVSGITTEIATLLGNYARALGDYPTAAEYYNASLRLDAMQPVVKEALTDIEIAMQSVSGGDKGLASGPEKGSDTEKL